MIDHYQTSFGQLQPLSNDSRLLYAPFGGEHPIMSVESIHNGEKNAQDRQDHQLPRQANLQVVAASRILLGCQNWNLPKACLKNCSTLSSSKINISVGWHPQLPLIPILEQRLHASPQQGTQSLLGQLMDLRGVELRRDPLQSLHRPWAGDGLDKL